MGGVPTGGLGACAVRGGVDGPADLMDGGALEGDAPAQQLRLPAAEGLMAGGGNQILGHELQPHPASHPRLRGCPTPKELYGAALQSTSAPHRFKQKPLPERSWQDRRRIRAARDRARRGAACARARRGGGERGAGQQSTGQAAVAEAGERAEGGPRRQEGGA